ncbi:hypothetical protein ALC62_00431 [Cyphomyrmex costatus]|uniref:Uncharacterized protein n=1 Tax=Cyphomyrmex costatus TaxID=456900 RepID=A0A151IQR7_9HYME|nr:hypothetical protein ALC62_00431 [Cyphomyrmex costatus]
MQRKSHYRRNAETIRTCINSNTINVIANSDRIATKETCESGDRAARVRPIAVRPHAPGQSRRSRTRHPQGTARTDQPRTRRTLDHLERILDQHISNTPRYQSRMACLDRNIADLDLVARTAVVGSDPQCILARHCTHYLSQHLRIDRRLEVPSSRRCPTFFSHFRLVRQVSHPVAMRS